jgi:hypothetical protein
VAKDYSYNLYPYLLQGVGETPKKSEQIHSPFKIKTLLPKGSVLALKKHNKAKGASLHQDLSRILETKQLVQSSGKHKEQY